MKKLDLQLLTVVCIMFCSMQSVKAFEKDINTVGLWNMNEGKGTTLYDSSGNDINFKLYMPSDKKDASKPKWVVTPNGKGLIFRAEDGRQFGAKPVKLTNQVTFEIWLKPVKNGKSMGLYQSMIYKQNGYRVNLSSSLSIGFLLNGKGYESGLNSQKALKSGEWSHVACTYDGKILRIYINGKLDNEKEMIGYDLSKSDSSTLGYTGGTPYFNGIIDSVRISNVPLTDFSESL